MKPGIYLLAKTRITMQQTNVGSIRLRSPVELCRVRSDKPLPTEFAELSLVQVEFLFADRYAAIVVVGMVQTLRQTSMAAVIHALHNVHSAGKLI